MASAPRTLLALAFAGALAAGAYFVMTGGDSGDDIGSVGFDLEDVESVEEDDSELLDLEAQRGDGPERVEVSDADAAAATAEVDITAGPDAELTLVGRVVAASGAAVADAEVNLFMRRDLETFFRNGGGRNFRRGGRDRQFFETFRLKRVAKTVRTGKDGRFRFVGPAFASSTVEVGVKHNVYAPSTVRRDWEVAKGELDVGDIKVEAGAMVFGRVISSVGQALENVELRWQSEGEGGRRGGRRGGRGRRGFFGRGGSPLEQLVGIGKTDARGMFELGPLPQGDFKLRASLERYLDAESADLVAEAAGRVDAGLLKLTLGSEIQGIILDKSGDPIAEATVRGRSSRNAENNDRNATRGEGRNERGRRGGRDRTDRGARQTRETKTDKNGKFALNALPVGALRIEVSHPRFVDEQRDPIDPAKESRVEIRLDKRTSIQGIVVDARTGKPIENFGIAARKSRARRGGDTGRFDRGNRRNRGENTSSAEEVAREAERSARARQEELYRARYFGPSGEAPQRRPKPEEHAGGRFVAENIDPGRWMLDVVAPGYASLADGPIEIERGKDNTEARTIRLTPASTLRGVVASSTTRKGLERASVEIFVPPMPSAAAANDERSMIRRMFRGRGGDGTRLARTRTDSKGEYSFEKLRAGTYKLVIRARDHLDTVVEKIVVAAGRENARDVMLGVGGTLRGSVRGYKDGMRLRLRHEKDGSARGDVEKDGSYEIKGLEPGGWFVSVEESGGGFGRRGASMFRQFMQTSKPDVYVQENRVTNFEVDASAGATCTVSGTVLANGMAADGYTVSLESAPNPSGQNDASRDFMRRMTSRFLRSTTREDGSYEVDNIPAGSWILKLARSGGGDERGGRFGRGGFGGRGGSSSAITSVPITLVAGQNFSHSFNVRVGGVEFDLRDQSGKALERVSLDLAFEAEVAGKPRDQWRDLPSYRRLRSTRGIAKADGLRQGRWSFVVRGAGITESVRSIFVGGGDAPIEVVELEVDPAEAKKAEEEREKRRAEREAERAQREATGGGRTRGRDAGGRNAGGRNTGGRNTGGRNTGGRNTGGRRNGR